MILNPNTSAEFDKAIESVLRRDVDAVVIGGTLHYPDSATLIEDTGHSVHLESTPITRPFLNIQSVRQQSPARYEYYRDLLTNHPGSKLPRSKRIKNGAGTIVAINWPTGK